jgi:predicted dehydrogenase
MRRALQLGIIGTGLAARQLYLPAFKELAGKVKLVACANRTRAKAEAYAKAAKIPTVVDSAEELIALPEVEAVLISLPIDLQPKYVLQALAANKAVLSEKPVGPSVAEGKKLLRAARKFEAPWLVGENFAFLAHAQQVSRWVAQGRLGEVRLVQVTQITKMDKQNPYFNTEWREKPRHIGGFVSDGGVHVANVVRRCFGMPVEVRGFAASFDPKLPPIDTAVATMRFESGALGTWTSCYSARHEGPFLRIYGSRANVDVTWDSATLRDASGKETVSQSQRNSFSLEFEHFAEVVLRGKAPAMTPDEALLDLTLVEALCQGKRA